MNIWIEATRPKTLIASIAPVLIGTAIAWSVGSFKLSIFIASFLFALCIQIGTNFANDYIDFIKGADTKERKGPRRLVQSGLVSVKKMRFVTFTTFSIAAIIGLYLMQVGGWGIGLLALLAILLGYLYTGGPYPLAYLGLGDIFVLLFFGPVSVAGTTYLQSLTISPIAIVAGLSPGLLSTAILALNNLRDIEQDKKAEKKTLPVRFGKTFGKWEIAIALLLPSLIPLFLIWMTSSHPFSLIAIVYLIFAIPITRELFKNSQDLPALFPKVGKTLTLYTLLFTIGWII